jgi:hypothetical protein
VILGLPCDLELLGGLKNTESLPPPIPSKAKGQVILGAQNPRVSRLRREKDQPVHQDNAALIELRSFDDVISLSIHADLFSAEQSLLPSAHATCFFPKNIVLMALTWSFYKAILIIYKCQFQSGNDLPTLERRYRLSIRNATK